MRSYGVRALLAAAVWMAPMLGATLGGCVAGDGGESFGDELARPSLQMLPGCYSVRYEFVEDREHDFFIEGNIEYMDVLPQGDGYLARNFLILDEDTVFLHWMQEWTPLGNGRWRMRVTDGAGNERYVSEGVWRMNQWEGEPALAAKPTRDSERGDYQTLQRRNIIQFTTERWVQSEINVKRDAGGAPVASEVGWIVYTQQPTDEACAPAVEMTTRPARAIMARAASRPAGW